MFLILPISLRQIKISNILFYCICLIISSKFMDFGTEFLWFCKTHGTDANAATYCVRQTDNSLWSIELL